MKYFVSGTITVACWVEVDADTAIEAIHAAQVMPVADVIIDGGFPVNEYWHLDNGGEPRIDSAEAKL